MEPADHSDSSQTLSTEDSPETRKHPPMDTPAAEQLEHRSPGTAGLESHPDLPPHSPYSAPEDILVIVDLDGVVLVASEATAQGFGKTREEFIGCVAWDLMPPEVARLRREMVAKAVSSGQPVRFADRREDRWFDSTITPLSNDKGEVHRVAVTGRDITELKQRQHHLEARTSELSQALAQLQEREATARALLDAPGGVVLLVDTQGYVVDCGEATPRRYGLSRDQFVGLRMDQFLDPEVASRRWAVFRGVVESGLLARVEDEHRGTLWDTTYYPIEDDEGQVSRVAVLARDATALRQTEEQLQEALYQAERTRDALVALGNSSRSVLRAETQEEIFNALGREARSQGLSASVFRLFDGGGEGTDAGPYLEAVYFSHPQRLLDGIGRLLGQPLLGSRMDITPGGLTETLVQASRSFMLDNPVETVAQILPADRKDAADELVKTLGTEQYIVAPLRLPDGLWGLIALSGRVISEHYLAAVDIFTSQMAIALANVRLRQQLTHQADSLDQKVRLRTQQLSASEERYRTLFENAVDAMYIHDMEGRILDANMACLQLLGYERDEFLAKSIFDVSARRLSVPQDQRPAQLEELRPVWQKPRAGYESALVANSENGPPGTVIPVEIANSPMDYAGQRAVLVAARDTRERMRAQDALRRSEELLRSQYEAIPIPTYTWRFDGEHLRLVNWNNAADRITGGTLHQSLNLTAEELTQGQPEVRAHLYDCLREKHASSREFEYTYETTGEVRWLHSVHTFVPPDMVLVHTIDITERHEHEMQLQRSEAALRLSEQRLLAQYDSIPIPTYTWKHDGECLRLDSWNSAAEMVTEGRIAKYRNFSVQEMYADNPRLLGYLRRSFQDQISFRQEMEYTYRTTGQTRRLNMMFNFVPPDMVLVHTQDITEQREHDLELERSRTALQQSEERLRAQYMALPIPSYTWKWDGQVLRLMDWNLAADEATQGAVSKLRNVSVDEMYADQPEIRNHLNRCFEQKTSFSAEAKYLYRTTGDKRVIRALLTFVAPDLVMVHTQDITERLEYEQGLRQSQEQAEQARIQAQRERNLVVSLSRAAEAVQRALTPEEVYAAIGVEAARLGYRVVVQDISEDRSHASVRFATQDGSLESVTQKLLRLSLNALRVPLAQDGFFSPLIEDGQSLYAEKLADITARAYPALQPILHRTFLRINVARAIFAPLVRDEYTSQMLAVCGNSLTEEDMPAITAFANQASVALHNAHLLDQLQHNRDRLRVLAQRVVTAQEEERQRLSRALHDEAGQALTVLSISLQLLQQDLPEDGQAWQEAASNLDLIELLRQRVVEAISLTTDTMDHLRQLAQDLRPPVLDAVGLDQAIRGLCRDFSRRTEIPVIFSSAGQDRLPPLPDDVSIAMYRLVQEALTNAARHGEATEIEVVFLCDGRQLGLSVEDNGRGFDPDTLAATPGDERGVGLLGIRERLEMVEGTLEIRSAPDAGTRIRGRVPIA